MSESACGVPGCGHVIPCPWHRGRTRPWAQSADGQRVLDAVAATTPDEWRVRALGAIRTVAARGRPFTADDVWGTLGEPPTHRLGPVLVAAAKAGLIRQVGKTDDDGRRASHGQMVSVWETCSTVLTRSAS